MGENLEEVDNAKTDINTEGYKDVNSTHSFHTVVFHLS